MSQDTEKYLYFKVGLLKDSFALEALWQDALRYHMIDQPAKLIAMRLTEYYELADKGPVQPRVTIPTPLATTPTPPTAAFIDRENREDIATPTSSTAAIRPPVTSPVAHPPAVRPIAPPPATPALNTKPISITADPTGALHREGETSLAVSAEVDQNAEEAADYWSLL